MLAEQDELLDGYAGKLSDAYEELTFLRRLTQQVQLCDVRRGLAEVALNILPTLRDLTSIEGLACSESSLA